MDKLQHQLQLLQTAICRKDKECRLVAIDTNFSNLNFQISIFDGYNYYYLHSILITDAPDHITKMHHLKKLRHFWKLHNILHCEVVAYRISLNSQKKAFSAHAGFKYDHWPKSICLPHLVFVQILIVYASQSHSIEHYPASTKEKTQISIKVLCKDKHNNTTKHNVSRSSNRCFTYFYFLSFETGCWWLWCFLSNLLCLRTTMKQ